MGPLELGEKLCSFARLGDRKKLKCFKLAGTQKLTTDCSLDLPRFTQIVDFHTKLNIVIQTIFNICTYKIY